MQLASDADAGAVWSTWSAAAAAAALVAEGEARTRCDRGARCGGAVLGPVSPALPVPAVAVVEADGLAQHPVLVAAGGVAAAAGVAVMALVAVAAWLQVWPGERSRSPGML